MPLKQNYQPRENLTRSEIASGLRYLTLEGIASMGFTSITTSGFLAAYALALGADNLQIGILSSSIFIVQLLQIPAVILVEKIRRRKLIAVSTWLCSQLLWFPIAAIPFITGSEGMISNGVTFLISLMALRGILSSVTNCNWNSWVRDLVPRPLLGRYFSRRLAFSSAAAAVFGLLAGLFVDFWGGRFPDESILGYTWVILFGALFLGLASPYFMSRIPEPRMKSAVGQTVSLTRTLLVPLRDKNFRQLMKFLISWSFALNLAVPFFAVYMIEVLGFSVTFVIALAVLSQVFNILFLNVWGPLVDRFGSKVVLSLCASLYIVVILGWTFTTMPEKYFFTIPLLVILHIFAGIASAGINLTIGTIGMKLAPSDQPTPFLAGASLATNLGAGLGPLAGGFLAQFFSVRNLALDLTWSSPGRVVGIGVVNIGGFDFLFLIAFIIGLITLNTLTAVKEAGETRREIVLGELLAQTRASSNGVSLFPLQGIANMFPFGFLRKVPGIDVAIGVTAYQLGETGRIITVEVDRSRNLFIRFYRSVSIKRIKDQVRNLLSRIKGSPR